MIIVNGNISNGENIILDSGYNFGRGVFETLLVTDRPLFLKEHCERLKRGLAVLNIGNSADGEYILRYVQKYDIYDCILKVIVTEKNIVMSTRRSVYNPEDYVKGFKVKLSSLKRNSYSHTAYIKSLNYTDNILEKEQAAREGFDEVLFLNTHGELAEGSVSNVFFAKENKIFTPTVECGILDGIVRRWVINNFSVSQGRFPVEDLEKADEVFLTNSVMGIMKVRSFENNTFTGGSIYESIRNAYEKYIH